MSVLTAELFARAIIASAVSMDDLATPRTPNADGQIGIRKRHLRPAAVAVALEAKRPLTDICRILQIEAAEVAVDRHADKQTFQAAQKAAREAIAYHLRTLELKALAATGAEPADKPLRIPVEHDVAMVAPRPAARPSPRPAPSRPEAAANPPGRALPKGARFVNLGDGVQRVESKPISERAARMAKQQLDRGADLAFVAECFDAEPEALKAAIDALTNGRAA